MIIHDHVYGDIRITDRLVTKILKSPTLQRLKGVNQWGYTKPFYGKINVNRFDHSVGVYLLLTRYNAPYNEQIAGLIHDISHSAFSHTIDFLVKESSPTSMDHQDNIMRTFLQKSELNNLFSDNNIDTELILNHNNFPLLEKPQPKLCADRIDYLLRDALTLKEIDRNNVKEFLANLVVKNNNWAFLNAKIALKFAKLMQLMNRKYYASFHKSAVMHHLAAEYLRMALKKGYITMEDVYSNDNHVLRLIAKYHKSDAEIKSRFTLMNNPRIFENKNCNDSIRVKIKSRAIDPLFISSGGLAKLSTYDAKWKQTVINELKPVVYYIHPKQHILT